MTLYLGCVGRSCDTASEPRIGLLTGKSGGYKGRTVTRAKVFQKGSLREISKQRGATTLREVRRDSIDLTLNLPAA